MASDRFAAAVNKRNNSQCLSVYILAVVDSIGAVAPERPVGRPAVGTSPEDRPAVGTAPEGRLAVGTAPEDRPAVGTAPEGRLAVGFVQEDISPEELLHW